MIEKLLYLHSRKFKRHRNILILIHRRVTRVCRMLRGSAISYDWYKSAEGQGLLAHLTDPATGYRHDNTEHQTYLALTFTPQLVMLMLTLL